MGYHSKSNYEERDRLFEKSFQERGTNKNQVKKELEALFSRKAETVVTSPTGVETKVELCATGHAWIRDWDGVYKCVRCKALKPIAPKASSSPVG